MKTVSKIAIFDQVKTFLSKNPNGVIEILGPTGSGKTGFSIEFSKILDQDIEVISVDSRQVFRDCNISSAKITDEEMQGVPHHGIDIVDLDAPYNVAMFQKYAFQKIDEIKSRGRVPVLCGGTGLWLDAISENYVFSEEKEAGQFKKSTVKATPLWPVFKIGLHWDREVLYDRLNARAKHQFENGLIEETKYITKKYPAITRSAWTSFGYQEVQAYLAGEITYDEALTLNQKRNRNYAKRQLTWWRGREDVNWTCLAK